MRTVLACVRTPIVLEGRELHADTQRRLDYVPEARGAPGRPQFSRASHGTGHVPRSALIGPGIERSGGIEEEAEGHEPAARVPDTRADDGSWPGDAAHLRNGLVRSLYV